MDPIEPKKARLRDLAGIWLLGLGISLMSPEWRRFTRMTVAANVIAQTAREAVAKHEHDRQVRFGAVPQTDKFPAVPTTDSEARTDDHIPGRGGW